jgi:hypothetical protein
VSSLSSIHYCRDEGGTRHKTAKCQDGKMGLHSAMWDFCTTLSEPKCTSCRTDAQVLGAMQHVLDRDCDRTVTGLNKLYPDYRTLPNLSSSHVETGLLILLVLFIVYGFSQPMHLPNVHHKTIVLDRTSGNGLACRPMAPRLGSR